MEASAPLPNPHEDSRPTRAGRGRCCGCCCTSRRPPHHDLPADAFQFPLKLKTSKWDRVAYFLDRILVRRWRFFVALATWGLVQAFVGGVAYSLVLTAEEGDWDDPFGNFGEALWEAWTFMADPGTHAKAYSKWERIVGSAIALCGILFFASILGVTVDMIREKMDSIRQGKSKIIEKDHTLILGWTEKTTHIIEELCKANESEGGGVVAVLAPAPKEQMELELGLQLPVKARLGTRVIFRNGSPLVISDLIRVSVHMAKSIIILAATGSADQADADTLRTMLSLQSLYSNIRGHIVVEVRDIDNENLVKLVGGSHVETIVSHDMIGRLMLMSVRQPGLAKVYGALLGFDGDEFYMKEWPELSGLRFGDLSERFPDAVPIGVLSTDDVLTLRPPVDREISPGDKIIVIAEDNDTYRPEGPCPVEAGVAPVVRKVEQERETILFCGWRRDIRDVLQQLDKIVRRGTEVHMMTHCVPIHQRNERLLEEGLDVRDLQNLALIHHFGNTSVRRKLEALPIDSYSSCMIFADQAFESDTLHADSHSLATLLLIRNIQFQNHGPAQHVAAALARSITDLNSEITCPIVCEVLDPHTQKTIANSKGLSLTSDFCQTNKLVAQVLAMISEERSVALLFEELLGNVGCNIAVVPSSRYAYDGEHVNFYMLAKRAARQGELLFGYQVRNSIEKTVLNPRNKDKMCLWDKYDLAILRGDVERRNSFAESFNSDDSAETAVELVGTPQNCHTDASTTKETLDAHQVGHAEASAANRAPGARQDPRPVIPQPGLADKALYRSHTAPTTIQDTVATLLRSHTAPAEIEETVKSLLTSHSAPKGAGPVPVRYNDGGLGALGAEFAKFVTLCKDLSKNERLVLGEALSALRESVLHGLEYPSRRPEAIPAAPLSGMAYLPCPAKPPLLDETGCSPPTPQEPLLEGHGPHNATRRWKSTTF